LICALLNGDKLSQINLLFLLGFYLIGIIISIK
jgi:hypothetical protein